MIRDIEFAEQALIFANADLFEECPAASGIKMLRDDWCDRYSHAKEKLESSYKAKVEAQKAALRIRNEIFHKMLWDIAKAENTSDLGLFELLEMDYRLQVLAVCYGKPLGSILPSNIVVADAQ